MQIDGLAAGDSLGGSVSGGGDFNGDGIGDLIIGAAGVYSQYGAGFGNAGEAYVIFGPGEAVPETAFDLNAFDGDNGVRIEGVAATNAYTGQTVAFVGDMNGDGFDDVAVDTNYSEAGSIYDVSAVIFGRDVSNQAQVGTAGADNLTGDGNDNVLVGGQGNDTLIGLAGNDALKGATGNDSLDGGDGDDILSGGAGDDTLIGGDGADTIDPGSNSGNGDLIQPGADSNLITFNDPGVGFFILNYTDQSVGIDATFNNTDGTVVKTGGTDTIEGVNAIDGVVGGLMLLGGSGDDTVSADLIDQNEFFQFRGGAGNDDFTGGGGFDRLDYVAAAGGITANLELGQTTDDGDGGIDVFSAIDEIRGSDFNDSLLGSSGNDRFITRQGDDTVDGGAGFDLLRYDRSTVENVDIDLSAGTASVTQNGFLFNETISNIESVRGSRTGSDTLTGDSNANRLDGRGGDDSISGGDGNDTLNGEEGNDTINTGDGVDTANGGDGTDLLVIDFGATGNNNNITIQGTTDDITQATGFDQFGDVKTISGFEQAFLTGANGQDLLAGGALDDTLIGGDGFDTLNGGSGGADVLQGGLSDDTLIGVATSSFDGGDGDDFLQVDLSALADNISLVAGGGTVTFSDGTDITAIESFSIQTGTGNDNFDLSGQDFVDTISTGAGNDTIDAGQGSDNLDGGAGTDLLIIDFSSNGNNNNITIQGTTDDITQATGFDQFGVNKVIAGFEQVSLTGAGGSDVLAGGALNDTLFGGLGDDTLNAGSAGDDSISGGGGNDSITARDGNDLLIGGAGSDILTGGLGNDTASASDLTEGVNGNLGTNSITGLVTGDVDTLSGIEALTGSDQADSLTGDGAANTLDGGAGDDILQGGFGADSLIGGEGQDTASFDDGGSSGANVDLAAGTATDGLFSTDTLIGIEHLLGDSFFSDTLSGDANANQLDGQGGFDSLSGLGGDDTLIGGAGNDTLDGGADNDTADYSGAAAGIAADIGQNLASNDGDGGTDSLLNIETLVGSSFNDTIFGGASGDQLEGGAGNDNIDGGGAGSGNDSIFGGAGADTLFGNDADDTIDGGADNDFIEGGAGVDTLTGGGGADTFVYTQTADLQFVAQGQTVSSAGVAVDLITDFAGNNDEGSDKFEFDEFEGDFPSIDGEAIAFQTIGVDYDGTNSGLGAGSAYIFDGTHLIFDSDVTGGGYEVVANTNGSTVVEADLSFNVPA